MGRARSVVAGAVLTATLVLGGPAYASGPCRSPGWAPPLPGYAVDKCSEKALDDVKLELTKGDQWTLGHRRTFEYTLKDAKKSLRAQVLWDRFVRRLEKEGARLVSGSGDDAYAVLRRKSRGGVRYYRYESTAGGEDGITAYELTGLVQMPLPEVVAARRAPGALPSKAHRCIDPPWLSTPYPGYRIASCEVKGWDKLDLAFSSGDRNVTGRRYTVDYALPAALVRTARDPVAQVIALNYLHALEKIGARLVSDPSDDSSLVLSRQMPGKVRYYLYQDTSGSEESTTGYSLTTLDTSRFKQVVVGRPFRGTIDTRHCRDPRWLVKQFPYFKRATCESRDLASVKLDLASGDKVVAGRVQAVTYQLTEPSKSPIPFFVWKNYASALKKIGASLASDPSDDSYACFSQKLPSGTIWYLYENDAGDQDSTTSYTLETIQVGGPPPKTCKVEVYGIRFDFNKATLRPDSKPVLEALLGIFRTDPGYRAEIGGHTDNAGSAAYNLELSRRRAAAVRAWLVAHGVAASRLTSRGYGERRPLVPNTTAKNRAKNRRVELERKDCHRG